MLRLRKLFCISVAYNKTLFSKWGYFYKLLVRVFNDAGLYFIWLSPTSDLNDFDAGGLIPAGV